MCSHSTEAGVPTPDAQCSTHTQQGDAMRSHQHTDRVGARRSPKLFALLLAIGLGTGLVTTQAVAQPATKTAKPTVVLVHGAFADAESWNGVTTRLIKAGYPVIA